MKVNIALLTVTDTRTFDNDKSGNILVDKIKIISSLLSLHIFLSIKLWFASFIFLTRMAPDLSLSKVLVSVTVNKAIFTIIFKF